MEVEHFREDSNGRSDYNGDISRHHPISLVGAFLIGKHSPLEGLAGGGNQAYTESGDPRISEAIDADMGQEERPRSPEGRTVD